GRGGACPDRPDDLEVLDAASGAARAPLEELERPRHDARIEADEEQHAVGDLPGQFDGLRTRCGHQDGQRPARRIREAPARAAPQHLTVENADAVESRGLGALDEPHQLRHRSGAGNAEMHADGRRRDGWVHARLLTAAATSPVQRRMKACGSGTNAVMTNCLAPAVMARRICAAHSAGVPAMAKRSARYSVSPKRSVSAALPAPAISW